MDRVDAGWPAGVGAVVTLGYAPRGCSNPYLVHCLAFLRYTAQLDRSCLHTTNNDASFVGCLIYRFMQHFSQP